MRRVFARCTRMSAIANQASPGATTTPSQSHSHAAGPHHHHSHGAIESNIVGQKLWQCKLAVAAGGATNIFFSITKIWLGSAGGSVALIADGFHALTDIVADVVSYGSIALSRKRLPRCRFPFGIGRLETAGAVVVAAILLIGGIILLVQSAELCGEDLVKLVAYMQGGSTADADHAHDDHSHSHGNGTAHHGHSHFEITTYNAATGGSTVVWTMVLLAGSSVLVKELLFRWTRRVGLRAGSRVVVANAYHHRADAWSGAVALFGVAGQYVGIPGIDGLAGLAVSLSICQVGYGLLKGSAYEFFDFQFAEEVAQVRKQLQLFHMTATETDVVADDASSEGSGCTPRSGGAVRPARVNDAMVRFINVFLMRHGQTYALHVTLLVGSTLAAWQIEEATEKLTALARGQLEVVDTSIGLLVCTNTVVTRAEFFASRDGAQQPQVVFAVGDEVNPSLEKVLQALSRFHGFTTPISYDWGERTMTVPFAILSSSCLCDVESVAKMFGCKLKLTEEAENEDHDHGDCTHHGHAH